MASAGPINPILGPPPVIESRLKVAGFVDDLKCILRSHDEFKTLDHIISLFENSSGSKLHRDPQTKKCQLLALGRWSAWKQTNSPLDYMRVTEELNILGVRMTRSTQTTRVINGEELVQRVRDATNAFKAGRFLPLTTRPWVTNIYLMSRINYRSCALNLRQQDIQKIQSATKSWVTQGYLLKPNEIPFTGIQQKEVSEWYMRHRDARQI